MVWLSVLRFVRNKTNEENYYPVFTAARHLPGAGAVYQCYRYSRRMNRLETDHHVEIVHDGLFTVIKGKRGAGKTTCLLRLYHDHPEGIGFWSRKDWNDGELLGYSLVDIVTGESRVLCRRVDLTAESLPEDFHGTIVQGDFRFDQQVFEWAVGRILHAPRPVKIWLDEVGKIERQGGGFAPIISYARKNRIPFVMTKKIRW